MNRIVLKWAPIPLTAAVLMVASPSYAKSGQELSRTPVAQGASAKTTVPPAVAPKAAYASAGCTTVRRRLWTDAGWIVRRVTLCP